MRQDRGHRPPPRVNVEQARQSGEIRHPLAARYGVLGLPLAFASIPLYVHVPAFYAAETGLGLGAIGAILLLVRLADMVADPAIGSLSDRFQNRRKAIMWCAVPLFAFGFAALFHPPTGISAGLWLAATLILVYAGYSALAVNYYALGVGLAGASGDHTRLALWREGAMLVGVLLASLLPTLLSSGDAEGQAYGAYGYAFALLLPVAALVTLSLPFPKVAAANPALFPFRVLRLAPVRWSLIVAFFNALPTAITSTLFLFFVTDVLVAGAQAGGLLALYFVSAVAGMPLWSWASARIGLTGSILTAMLSAILVFGWAALLGPGDVAQFYVICVLAGLSLGADTVLLPALFARQLDGAREEAGAAFGWWHFLNKAALALAAGIALPVLAFGGYAPNTTNDASALTLLSAAYALAPCACKALAAILLYISPLHRNAAAHEGGIA